MSMLIPPVLAEVENTARERANGISVSVIDWIATVSEWKLPLSKHPDWTKQVVQGWFELGNTETADAFLERAEAFLQTSFRGESNGAKILHKVIQVESYVVFLRMEAMEALLLHEYCSLQKTREDKHKTSHEKPLEPGQKLQGALALPISWIVSSSNWHVSFTRGKSAYLPSAAHVSDVARRLRRIACLPPEVLEKHEYRLDKVDFVDWEPL